MSVKHVLVGDRETVNRYIAKGASAEEAEWFAMRDMIDAELSAGPFYNDGGRAFPGWLKRKGVDTLSSHFSPYLDITPELWDEWQAVKATRIAALNANVAIAKAAEKEKRAAELAERNAEAQDLERRERLVAKVQAFELPPFKPLEPLDYKQVYEWKKNPDKSKHKIVQRWCGKFRELPGDVRTALDAFHQPELHESDGTGDVSSDEAESQPSAYIISLIPLAPGDRKVDIYNIDEVVRGWQHSQSKTFQDFRRYSASTRRALDVIGNPIDAMIDPPYNADAPQPAQDVDDIEAPDVAAYVVPGLIPYGATVAHGEAGACKSLFLQRMAVAIADDTGATFDGRDIEHGQVIFATLDPSASPEAIKPGIIEIRERLGLKASGRLQLTRHSLILNEPSSVAHWIDLNKVRLPAKVIVIDSLFSAVVGDLAQATVVQGAMEGVRTLLRHANAVVIAHHDNKKGGGDIFGSVFLTAMMASKIAITRNVKDGKPGHKVTVTVERLKVDDPALVPTLTYNLDGPFLECVGGADADADATAPIKRPDILVLLPTEWTALAVARKLVNLNDRTGEKTWQRLRKEWLAAKVIEQRDGNIRRVKFTDKGASHD